MNSRQNQNSSAIVFEPKIDLPSGVKVPDSYVGDKGKPLPDFVVSRHRDDTVASVYSDLRWDWTPYNPSGRSSPINFGIWCGGEPTPIQRAIIEEMHWLMFALIWLRNGALYSYSSLTHYVVMLNKLALFADSKNCKIHHVLNDPVRIMLFLDEFGDYYSSPLGTLVRTLRTLGEEILGIPVVSWDIQQKIGIRAQDYRTRCVQHPPIPMRIYSAILMRLGHELNDFQEVAEQYLGLVAACAFGPLLGRKKSEQNIIRQRLGIPKDDKGHTFPEFLELLDEYGLREYFKSKGLGLNIKGAIRGLSEVQLCAIMLIYAYSGMRRNEARDLPFYCLEEFTSGGKTHHLITGKTTKLNHGRIKRTRWVTSQEGMRAVQTTQKIADTIYNFQGVCPTKSKSRIDDFPLFVSLSYLGMGGHGYRLIRAKDRYLSSTLHLCDHKEYLNKIVPNINEEDLEELEQIDPNRPWRTEERYQLSKPWQLTTHQFRRSLALYASRSGLVALPSLRRQLQHITEEMSMYYARGSTFAKNIIDDKTHFGQEHQNTQPESEGLAYITNLLLSDERLFGATGTWIEQHKRKDRDNRGIMLEDRENTMRKFKRGEIAYKETPLGGCTEPGPCDKKALRSIVGCLDCARAAIKLSKLNRVISAQECLVAQLDPNTIVWRTEKEDLDVMIAAHDKYVGQ